METIRVAVVQAGAVVFDADATLKKLHRLALDAGRQGAKLAVFPEAFVSAYPKGLDFGARLADALTGRPRGVPPLLRQRHRRARPGDRDARRRRARGDGVYLVVGVIERDGGTLYCTVLFFAPDGTLLGKHRKLMPTALERLVWGFGDGSTLPVVRHAARQARRGDLLGELHAAAAHGDVRQGRRSSTARRPPTTARPGCRRCGTSRSKAAASCCRPASTCAAPTVRRLRVRSRATTRRRC